MQVTDLTGEEARVLANEYLQRLMQAGVTTMNSNQKYIYNGLCAHYRRELAREKLNSNPNKHFVDFWIETVDESSEQLIECWSFVNQWLNQGKPLDIEVE